VAVGVINRNSATLIEQWDRTSWSIIISPDPTTYNTLDAVTALSDGTAVAVGAQENNNTGVPTPLILPN
jgi:hypothetical protein